MSSTGPGDFDRQRIVVADEDLAVAAPRPPIVYLANAGRSTLELEAQLPAGVPIVREPFTAEELRSIATALVRTSEPLQ